MSASEREIREIMDLQRRCLEQVFESIEKEINTFSSTKNGVQYIESNLLKMRLRNIRSRVLLVHRGIIKS